MQKKGKFIYTEVYGYEQSDEINNMLEEYGQRNYFSVINNKLRFIHIYISKIQNSDFHFVDTHPNKMQN